MELTLDRMRTVSKGTREFVIRTAHGPTEPLSILNPFTVHTLSCANFTSEGRAVQTRLRSCNHGQYPPDSTLLSTRPASSNVPAGSVPRAVIYSTSWPPVYGVWRTPVSALNSVTSEAKLCSVCSACTGGVSDVMGQDETGPCPVLVFWLFGFGGAATLFVHLTSRLTTARCCYGYSTVYCSYTGISYNNHLSWNPNWNLT
ncbi:hypothetical protein BO86DRAFT_377295 [Aspergillus japonicus CBS 114.51]|uniref:Uncharacterized protein n=1 Tax=Aspergillus japonicus CBS 114.51 TaxID=1448312 RepID=A0A8T8X7T0_ASPJA|nr:hypothetical protein BO86DRAFT_377295 [Aspergillus japonicus CBS 114.51]RAH84075.1 hypothetical protein BO86DRAFT_377295 [Aspergillus japonicus CBS 114.51]